MPRSLKTIGHSRPEGVHVMIKRETVELLRHRKDAAWDAYEVAKAEFMAYRDRHFPGDLLLDPTHETATGAASK